MKNLLLLLFILLLANQVNAQCPVTDQTVTVSPTSGVCTADAVVSIATSEIGINYYLRNDADNSVIEGPIAGTGSQIDFTSETITTTKTYNVYATSSRGINFDGVDDKVTASAPSLPTGNSNYTIEVWVKPTSVSNDPTVLGWGNGGVTNQFNGIALLANGDINNYWWSNDLIVTPTTSLTDGNWHHIACTFNGTTRSIYVNGILLGSDNPNGHNTVGTNLTMGAYINDTFYFNGDMDDVRVWDTARTVTEISENMNINSPIGSGLVAHYKFDEGTGITANDSSTNNQTGMLINMNAASSWIQSTPVSICELEMTSTPTATITNPEIDIVGNGISIMIGDTTPDVADGTDFGKIDTSNYDDQTYFIDNSAGTEDLNVTSIVISGTNASGFAIVGGIPDVISAGGYGQFNIRFAPAVTGYRTATITINIDDCNENTYDFAVQGLGVTSTITVSGTCSNPDMLGDYNIENDLYNGKPSYAKVIVEATECDQLTTQTACEANVTSIKAYIRWDGFLWEWILIESGDLFCDWFGSCRPGFGASGGRLPTNIYATSSEDTALPSCSGWVAGSEGCTPTISNCESLNVIKNTLVNDLKLFPNPTKGDITLSYSGQESLKTLTILDVTGKKIKTITLNNFNKNKNLSLQNLKQGLYFVTIESDINIITKTVIIK